MIFFSISGQIVDDEMNSILVQQLPRGARLTAIFDSCHSATALDLPYVYNEMGEPKKQKLNKLVKFLQNVHNLMSALCIIQIC